MSVTHRSATEPLTAGVYAALSTSTFTAASPIFRVYVPQGQCPPYAVLQNFTENPGWETFGKPAKDCTFQLRVVSQSRGEKEASDILNTGVGIVMRGFGGSTQVGFTVANHAVMLVEYEGSEGYEEEDDAKVRTFHRVGRFRVQLDQTA